MGTSANISMEACTNGTLSTTAELTPMSAASNMSSSEGFESQRIWLKPSKNHQKSFGVPRKSNEIGIKKHKNVH